ncbi:hypothetical protein [Bacillus thuringiensis]|uniref:hypothetical protein n=1 Tax=Bacillus thuringiensis TaxID=1428 RepID=UPI000BFB4CE0|nr:hypothetical protein [Bacillus thuringiensis]PGT90073.1 hypothetical protein COD17_10005 [Bacillus thuringiensis]
MKTFGIVAGRQSETMAGTITGAYPDIEFTKAWTDLRELKNDLTKKDRGGLGELQGILVLDWGLPSETTEEEFSHIVFIQNMLQAKEFFGLYIFFCTKRADLYKRLDEHFTDMPDTKYDGTKLDLVSGYDVDNMYALLTFPYALLKRGSKELEIRRDEQRKAVGTIMDTRRFYTLMGRKDQISSMMRKLEAEMRVIESELTKFTEERLARNLEYVDNDLQSGIKKKPNVQLLEDVEVEKAVEEVEQPKKKNGFFGW